MNNQTKSSALRIIDAAQNRAAEGMRVVEDVARMHREDACLAQAMKQLRHQLTAALSTIDSSSLLQSRNPATDVGTQISTEAEFQRANLTDLVRSNFGRVLQSLRTIEEYSKLLAESGDASIPQQLEQLRYQTYTLEKAIVNSIEATRDLHGVQIYALVDSRGSLSEFEELARSLIQADVCLIQLRDKSLDDRTLIQYGKLLSELTRDVRTRWIMNDRADLALICGADGVHVGQEDLSVHQARQIVGPGKLVGVSTHDIQQARAAELAGANYIGVGPCFPSGTKSFDKFVPTDLLSSVSSEILVPAFAIGGIDTGNVEQLSQLGIQRVAVSKMLIQSKSILKDVEVLKLALNAERMTSKA